jgi:hypothetical protein
LRRVRVSPVLLAFASLIPACSFLLDFDELSEGDEERPNATAGEGGEASGGRDATGGDAPTNAGEAGRDSTAGGAGGAGGEGEGGVPSDGGAGGTPCATDCADDDPCTRDACVDGECVNTLVPGLALDGVDETIVVDQHVRATIAASSDGFFISDFFNDAGASDLDFYRLGAAPEDTLEPVFSLADLELLAGAVPVSAAGLAMDNDLGRIHAFIGLRERQADGARVFHAVVDLGYAVRSRAQAGTSYFADVPQNHPAAMNLGGNVYSAWINEDRSVSLHGGAGLDNAVLAAGTPASTLTLLGSAGNLPVVLYGSEGLGVFLERPNVAPVTVPECQPAPGVYSSAGATYAGVAGFWLTNWTKFGSDDGSGDGFLTSDGRGVACSAVGCTVADTECPSDSNNNLERNVATLSALRPGDRTGIVHYAAAVPSLTADDDGNLQAVLGLALYRVDFGLVPFESAAVSEAIGAPLLVSSLPTEEATGFAGPDWPVLAYVPPDHLALAFIQPADDRSELRVQRYRMCLP